MTTTLTPQTTPAAVAASASAPASAPAPASASGYATGFPAPQAPPVGGASMRGGPVLGRPLEVTVDADQVDRALNRLKRKMADEGILKELKKRRFYEKPSVKKKRKMREAERRRRKEAKRRVARGRLG